MAEKLPSHIKEIIKKVAWFEKKHRDDALDDLRIYFNPNTPIPSSVLTLPAMIVIWKGLHGGMLHQDQPLLQEELADKISSLVYCFKKEKSANLFVQAGLETFAREWNRVNQYMVNKMMMFFRRLIRQALFRLANQKWLHSDLFMKMLTITVIRPLDHDNRFPLAPKMHLSSIFMEELAKASNEHLTHNVLMTFLTPFIDVLAQSRQQQYVNEVRSCIFQHLIRQSDLGVENRADLLDNEFLVPTKKSMNEKNEVDDHENEVENGMDEENESEIDGSVEELDKSEDGSDDEGEKQDDSEDIDDDDDDDDEEEEGEELHLDPRAGNVDVYLPQLSVDYDNLTNTLMAIMDAPEVPKKNREKMRKLVKELTDLLGGVYTLEKHPTLHPVHEQMDEEVAEVDVDRAIKKRMMLFDEEFRAIKKPRKQRGDLTKEQLEEECTLIDKTKSIIQKERSEKWKAISHRRNLYEKRKAEKTFQRYAKRTLRLKQKLDLRRLKAKGVKLPTSEEKLRKLLKEREKRENALMGKIHEVVGGFTVTKKSEKQDCTETNTAARASQEPCLETAAQVKGTDKHTSTNDSELPPKTVVKKTHAKPKEKINTGNFVAVNQSQLKKCAISPGIKINLKGNQQHDFNDYHRSILASPGIPYQPEKTPLTSALKATSTPILVKKPLSRTLKNLSTNGVSASTTSSPSAVKLKNKRKGNSKVLKDIMKKGLQSGNHITHTDKDISDICVKEKAVGGNKTSPLKPAVKKLPSQRACASDFF